MCLSTYSRKIPYVVTDCGMIFHRCLKRLTSCNFSNPRRFSSFRSLSGASLTSDLSVNHRPSISLNSLSGMSSPFVFSYELAMYQFRQMQEYFAECSARTTFDEIRRTEALLHEPTIPGSIPDGAALVTVLNYNVLAQDLIDLHPYLYRSHNPEDLVWAKRQQLLFNEFLQSNADVIALQEVQQDHIEPFYKLLENYGYKGVFKKRTSREKTDGCAFYYKVGVFDLIETEEVEYNQPGISVLNRPNVAIIAKLRHKLNHKELVIANTHLLYNPKRWNIRLAQIQVLLAELHRIVGASKSAAVMLVGDLNSDPRSPIIRLIEKGFYEADDPVLPDHLGILPNCTHKSKSKLHNSKLIMGLFDDEEDSGSEINNEHCTGRTDKTSEQGECTSKESPSQRDSFLRTPEGHQLSHGFNFTSTYNFYDSSYRSEATTYQDRWINVDYMFYSNMILVSRKRLPTVDECVQHIRNIPNAISPSDHLPLLATYAL